MRTSPRPPVSLLDAGGFVSAALCIATELSCNGDSLARFTYATTMDVSSSWMRVVETTRRREPRGVSGTLEVSPTGSIPRRENPAGKSPMTRSKPLGPSFASGKMHQREYGPGHAAPDHRVETSSDQNQISQTQVHGTRGRRRRRHDRFRLRFRLVSPVPAHSDGKSGAPIQRCSIRGRHFLHCLQVSTRQRDSSLSRQSQRRS